MSMGEKGGATIRPIPGHGVSRATIAGLLVESPEWSGAGLVASPVLEVMVGR